VNDLDLVVIVVVATALGAVGHRLELGTIESVRLIPFALARIRRPGSHRGRRRVAPRAAAAATESLAFTSWPTAAEPTSAHERGGAGARLRRSYGLRTRLAQ
jgi:hypothetical protein